MSPPRGTDTLVVAPSWVGDAVLSHPLLIRLKEREPGGRIDVLDGQPVAVLVYRLRAHLIDVYI